MSTVIFNDKKREAKLERAVRRNATDAAFLQKISATIVGERLAVIQRKFTNCAILFDGPFSDAVIESILQEKPPIEATLRRINWPAGEPAVLECEPESLDLVVSIFDLHRINDLPAMLMQINHALKPDGLFMAAIPCEGTLQELKQSLLSAEVELTGGASARVDLFAHIRQLGDLMQKTGFKLPVADIEERTVRYSRFTDLIKDLRDMGAGNITESMEVFPLSESVFRRMEEIYQEKFSDPDGKLRATVNLGFLSGWKEDASQQKPLKPGSAKHKLSDFM